MVGFSDRAADASGRWSGANPDAARLGQALGNVTFIERPFHPTTLVSIVGSAVRARRRQYQTRAILVDLTESENLLQTALNAGHLGALELHLPEFELEASDICASFFGRKPGEPFTFQDLSASVHPDDRERRLEAIDQAIKTGGDYRIEYRIIWPEGSQHWVDTRARAVRRPDGSIKSLVGVCSESPRARPPKSSARTCWRNSPPNAPRSRN